MSDPHRYFVLHKPADMVSQFVSAQENVPLLGSLGFPFPEGTHAIGRLDRASEGLLLLTTNKKITRLLFESERQHHRQYLVRVRGRVQDATLEQLRAGVPIRIEGGGYYTTRPATVERIADPRSVSPLIGPYRVDIPHSWLLITLSEGRYHQVRKMVFTLGHRCQRLVRTAIEGLQLGDLPAGEVRELTEDEFFERLRLEREIM